jgi:catechol 2,3-dioxygenase-like lactoylglutathione lyase family enzyme
VSTEMSSDGGAEARRAGTGDMKLEVVLVPVSDVDRAKRFYEALGWRLDADFPVGDDFRVVQFTPPGSECSVIFGTGITSATPGSLEGLQLTVFDLDATRAEMAGRGVDVSDVFHDAGGVFHHAGTEGRAPGPAPEHADYGSFASFSDPDGNGWRLQEIRTRLPGRGGATTDVAKLTGLLREAEEHHGPYEATAPPHHLSGFYAAYIVARDRGRTPEEASSEAARHADEERASPVAGS